MKNTSCKSIACCSFIIIQMISISSSISGSLLFNNPLEDLQNWNTAVGNPSYGGNMASHKYIIKEANIVNFRDNKNLTGLEVCRNQSEENYLLSPFTKFKDFGYAKSSLFGFSITLHFASMVRGNSIKFKVAFREKNISSTSNRGGVWTTIGHFNRFDVVEQSADERRQFMQVDCKCFHLPYHVSDEQEFQIALFPIESCLFLYSFKIFYGNCSVGNTSVCTSQISDFNNKLMTDNLLLSFDEIELISNVSRDGRSVMLKWNLPLNKNAEDFTFRVVYSLNKDFLLNGTWVNNLTIPSVELNHLQPSSTYYMKIQYFYLLKPGQFSRTLEFITTAEEEKSLPDYCYYLVGVGCIISIFIIIIVFKFRSVHKRMVTLFQTSDNRSGSEDELPNFIEEIEMGKMSKDIKRSQSYKVTNDYKSNNKHRIMMELQPLMKRNNAPDHEFQCEIPAENIVLYDDDDILGRGEFGEVYRGKLLPSTDPDEQEDSIDVAVKQLHVKSWTNKQREDFLNEAMALERFRHPNVVRLEAVVTRTRPYMIITELMTYGSLNAFLRSLREQRRAFRAHVLIEMLRGVASGMAYLIGLNYVHRDLAARNVLVSSNLTCKVADFGLTRQMKKQNKKHRIKSTSSESNNSGSGGHPEQLSVYKTTNGGKIAVRWAAPEAVSCGEYTQASDVWSFGILSWEVMTYGDHPYWDYEMKKVVKALSEGFRLPSPENCPVIIHNIMLMCWLQRREDRPTFVELIHKFDNILNDVSCLDIVTDAQLPEEDFFAPTPAQTPMEGDVAPSFPASNSSDLHKYTTFRHDDNVDDEEEAKMMFIRPSARRLLKPRGGNATL